MEPQVRNEFDDAARSPDARDGIVGSIVTLSLGMIESGVRTAANVGRAAVGEGQKLTEAVIGLQEQSSESLLRSAREVNRLVFGLASDVIERLETAAVVGLSHGQKTTDRVAELAAQVSSAALGSRGLNGSATTASA